MSTINYKDMSVEYTITKKSNKKNLSLYVKYPGIVSVVTPLYTNDKFIEDFVMSKSKWIFDKLSNYKKLDSNSPKITLDDKSTICYMGKEYEITIIKSNNKNNSLLPSLEIKDNKFIIEIKDKIEKSEISNLLASYYIKQGSLDISKRISIYSEKLGVKPKKVTVKYQKTSWGSCSSLGNININYNLLLAPIDVIDYVLVHELCHLIEMNHSNNFWKLVETIIPDYIEKRDWLKKNGFMIKL